MTLNAKTKTQPTPPSNLLIKGNEVNPYLTKLAEIAADLEEVAASVDNLSLMSGKTGIALFFFYYGKFRDSQGYADIGYKLLEDVFDRIGTQQITSTFAGGLSGFGWTIEHLVQNNFIEADTTELLGELDKILYEAMTIYLAKADYDFFHGALGDAIYFLSRPDNPKTPIYLAEMVAGLKKLSKPDKKTSGKKWLSVLDMSTGLKGYDLGLSHGIPSIIFFLSLMAAPRKAALPFAIPSEVSQQAAGLLTKAVRYLLGQQLEPGQYESLFPPRLSDKEPIHNSRLAWCYGDPGIGMALYQAGHLSGEKQWQEKALEILQHTTTRRELMKSYPADAGLCHGTAGLGHMYNRLYQDTGKKIFYDAARYWFEETLKLATHEDGIAGYKVFYKDKWLNQPGLLEGAAGTGLAIISAISEIEPLWDRCLLLR